MTAEAFWEHARAIVHESRVRIRLSVRGDPGPSEWAPWVTTPSAGYVEVGPLGPVSVRDVEWYELDPHRVATRFEWNQEVATRQDLRDEVVARLGKAGVAWQDVDGHLRVEHPFFEAGHE